ncbi:unnamed protein product [Chondrus crispus]|uniref:Uncharacterized protein n=1 Tax=Chondrus crispus TaxID=2769 RepID=S0F3H6_CHOCR|nr:unnamed protein product [Chondrus crispus]CDF77404.1 unnamed protein product [Chondrus crispus]|eukprot:XP_005712278.1 unnamed protein product [Chondrus crispus]
MCGVVGRRRNNIGTGNFEAQWRLIQSPERKPFRG